MNRRLGRAALTLGATAALTTGIAPAAQAHDYLVNSQPVANSAAKQPVTQVVLTFNDLVLSNPIPALVTVTGPDGRHYESACPRVSDRTVTTPVALGAPGEYRATWRIVSADGHPVTSSIAFRTTTAGGGTGSATQRDCRPHPTAEKSQSGSHAPLIVVGLIALVGIAGVVLIVLRGRTSGAD